MASADKGRFVVLFTSGNFVFFKHKNDKGIYCPRSLLNSTRQVLKDDIYELTTENVTSKHKSIYPEMPDAAALMATKAKFVKTPRVIQGVGTMKKISQDGEYGFVEYQDGRSSITAFCTRITVKPTLNKGDMLKFFSAGCKVRFVAKEQPPSGMFNIEWRVIVATSMQYEISDSNYDKVTPVAAVPAAAARPAAAAPAVTSPVRQVPPTPSAVSSPLRQVPVGTPPVLAGPPPGLPPIAAPTTTSNGSSVSTSSSSSSVANGISYAARASQQLPPMPDAVAAAVHSVNSSRLGSLEIDETLPRTCPDPFFFSLTDQEKQDAVKPGFPELRETDFDLNGSDSDVALSDSLNSKWSHYKREDERALEAFEAELSQLSHVATALYGGNHHVCPISFASRVS